MKRTPAALLATILVTFGCNSDSQSNTTTPQTLAAATTQAQQTSAPIQNFDFYLLNLSWSPEFCSTHANAPECAAHSRFVLHGLWPQNNTGPFLENCSDDPGPLDPTQYSDIYPDPGLLHHEWHAHGTCSGLSPEAYFALVRTAYHSVTTPPTLLQLDHQIYMPPGDILDLFTKTNPSIPKESLALTCGNNYLTAVEVCLSKTLKPTSCGSLHTCGATTVRIPPP
jgi:ribonuclease T2